MDTEQEYGFDVWGFLHLERALSTEMLQACDGNRLESLLEYRPLNDYVQAILGEGFTLDQPPAPLHGDEAGNPVQLDAGDGQRNRRLRYIRIPYATACAQSALCQTPQRITTSS